MAIMSAGPVTRGERSLAPDVARGLALLGIALANSAIHLSGVEVGAGQRPVDASVLDRVVNFLVTLFVDRRTLPMFALLFAYGFVMVLRRQEAAGATFPQARRVLLRRCLWLGVFGLVHIALLFEGDILLPYAITGCALVLFLRAGDRALRRWAVWLLLPVGLFYGLTDALSAWGGGGDEELPFPEDAVLGALVLRLSAVLLYVVGSPLLVASFLSAMLAGVLLARRRVVEAPHEHLPLLRRLVVVGFAVSVVGGLPHALVVAGAWAPDPLVASLVSGVHGSTGVFGGVAFVALVALVIGTRARAAGSGPPAEPRGVVRALRAVGERSLTCYLTQSVLFVLPLAPWAGGLGVGMSSAQVVAWAVGVWLVTVVLAVVLDAAGRRGPAEVLLRRLVYGPRRRA